MLILCIGPDQYRALAKAQELERAFIEKHDPSGLSVERLDEGSDAVDQIIERVNTVSLFTPRRFIRVSNLVDRCPKAKQKALIQALGKDPERVIVVSVERDPPTPPLAALFGEVPKFLRYDFPTLSSKEFLAWVEQRAVQYEIRNMSHIQRIAQEADGDCWYASNELIKLAMGDDASLSSSTAKGRDIFQYAEVFLASGKQGRGFLLDDDVLAQAMTVFLSQSRAALRVRDQATSGLHPYLVKKLQKQIPSLEEKHAAMLLALFLQRAGYGDESEVVSLF